MNVLTFDNYKEYVQQRVRGMPHRGKGQFKKVADHLGIHTSLVSQIFNGPRNLTPEQACAMAGYLGLSPLESEYFVLLVQLERAGTDELRKLTQAQLARLRDQGRGASTAKGSSAESLTDRDRAIFYSSWYYSGVRLLTSIPEYDSLDAIASYLNLPQNLVRQVLEFLVSTGLCIETNGKFKIGPKHTLLEADSPLLSRHLQNWRIKAMEKIPRANSRELFYSVPQTLSVEDFPAVRETLVDALAKIKKIVDKSPEERLACLSIDWFEV
jgi:uncharacterized protein (TIGR02147 family)